MSLRGFGLRVLALALVIVAALLLLQGSNQLAVMVALGGLASYLAALVAA